MAIRFATSVLFSLVTIIYRIAVVVLQVLVRHQLLDGDQTMDVVVFLVVVND